MLVVNGRPNERTTIRTMHENNGWARCISCGNDVCRSETCFNLYVLKVNIEFFQFWVVQA